MSDEEESISLKEWEELDRKELRDRFAMSALTGMLSTVQENLSSGDIERFCLAAYRFADAMISARVK